eukprot:991163_1
MFSKMTENLCVERLIRPLRDSALLVEIRDQTLMFCLDEITHDFVVEIVHLNPSDSLLTVLVLLFLKSDFDENMLEFFIHVVDVKLLERVVLEDFKAVDIEHSDAQSCIIILATLPALRVDDVAVSRQDPAEDAREQKL